MSANYSMNTLVNVVAFGTKLRRLVRNRDPELYEATKEVNERHYAEVLPSAIGTMNWKENELILDHGSGCGSTTFDYILPVALKNDSKIIALDNSESMIRHGARNYAHERIEHVFGEITNPALQPRFKFNKIFSLYTLHHVDNYKQELESLSKVLTIGGELCMIVVTKILIFNLFSKLMEHDVWGTLAKEHLVVPGWLKEIGHEEEALKAAFEESGFIIQNWKFEERVHPYKNATCFADFMLSVNSFAKSLSAERFKDIQAIYRKFIIETETQTYKPLTQSDNSPYNLYYEVITIAAKKTQ